MASIRAKGSKFEVRVMLGGKSVSRTFPTQEEGQRWAAGVQYGFIAPTASKSTACAIPTLGEACDRYINEVVTTHKGAKQERYRAEALKKHPLAKHPINKITTENLRCYRDKMLADGLSGRVILP